MTWLDEDEKKAIIKKGLSKEQEEALIKGIDSWMDKQFAAFGKWTLFWIAAGLFGYFVMWRIKIAGIN